MDYMALPRETHLNLAEVSTYGGTAAAETVRVSAVQAVPSVLLSGMFIVCLLLKISDSLAQSVGKAVP